MEKQKTRFTSWGKLMEEFQFYNPGAKKKEKKTVNETEL